jgi:hypothetical protein
VRIPPLDSPSCHFGCDGLTALCVGMAEFEQTFIQRLADMRVAAMLYRGENNMLAYINPRTQEGRGLHLIA